MYTGPNKLTLAERRCSVADWYAALRRAECKLDLCLAEFTPALIGIPAPGRVKFTSSWALVTVKVTRVTTFVVEGLRGRHVSTLVEGRPLC